MIHPSELSSLIATIAVIVTGLLALGSIAYAVGSFRRGRESKDTRLADRINTEKTELISTYEKRLTALEEQLKEIHALRIKEHADNQKMMLEQTKAIADLQGQIKVYKELPLQVLADGIIKLSASNAEIRDILLKSANIVAGDRLADGHPDGQHVNTQVVDKQIIRGSA